MGPILAVFLGGMLGTALRLGLDDLVVHHDNTFPWSTLIANVVGSFLLGFLVARVWPIAPEWVRAGVGPGLLGGFTTFSAVVAAVVTLTASGHLAYALEYVAASLVVGILAAAAGLMVGRRRRAAPPMQVTE